LARPPKSQAIVAVSSYYQKLKAREGCLHGNYRRYFYDRQEEERNFPLLVIGAHSSAVEQYCSSLKSPDHAYILFFRGWPAVRLRAGRWKTDPTTTIQ
jgi:hypothetical protein